MRLISGGRQQGDVHRYAGLSVEVAFNLQETILLKGYARLLGVRIDDANVKITILGSDRDVWRAPRCSECDRDAFDGYA